MSHLDLLLTRSFGHRVLGLGEFKAPITADPHTIMATGFGDQTESTSLCSLHPYVPSASDLVDSFPPSGSWRFLLVRRSQLMSSSLLSLLSFHPSIAREILKVEVSHYGSSLA